MAAAVRVVTFPFWAVWRLITLLLLPVVFGAVSVWLWSLGWTWAFVPFVLCAAWMSVMAKLWLTQVRGVLRSLGRGTVRVRSMSRQRGDRL